MNDINQAILISSVTVITILLTIIGIQVALLLREFRRTIEKINNIVDDAGKISGSICKSIQELSSVTEVFKALGAIIRVITRDKNKNKKHG